MDCGQECLDVFSASVVLLWGAVLVDARISALKPKSLDHVHAAALPVAAETAWESLYDRAAIHPPETVLIHAGAGGVRHVATQPVNIHGCTVITTASSTDSIDPCRQLGADTITNYW
jgi:NADPH2:quinone reductase